MLMFFKAIGSLGSLDFSLLNFLNGLFDLAILLILPNSGGCSRCVLEIHIFALIEGFNWIYCRHCCFSMPYTSISCWNVNIMSRSKIGCLTYFSVAQSKQNSKNVLPSNVTSEQNKMGFMCHTLIKIHGQTKSYFYWLIRKYEDLRGRDMDDITAHTIPLGIHHLHSYSQQDWEGFSGFQEDQNKFSMPSTYHAQHSSTPPPPFLESRYQSSPSSSSS